MAAESHKPSIGVLAVQGDVAEHLHALQALEVRAHIVKTPAEVDAVDGLIVPGGESTTVIRLMERYGLDAAICKIAQRSVPIWGTCMGMIVIARSVVGMDQRTLGLLDVSVRRNAFGRQIESAEMSLPIPALGARPFPAVFIRAPWIEAAGAGVSVLAALEGHGVLVRQGAILGSSFHPELTRDTRLHAYFLAMVAASSSSPQVQGKLAASA